TKSDNVVTTKVRYRLDDCERGPTSKYRDNSGRNIMEDEGNSDCLLQVVRGILLEKKPDLDREVAQIP
ncbi:hypothetical protein J6590_090970, partial [Homalodisca vitripennis]